MKEGIFRLFFSILLSKNSGIEVFHNFVMPFLVDDIIDLPSFKGSPPSHNF